MSLVLLWAAATLLLSVAPLLARALPEESSEREELNRETFEHAWTSIRDRYWSDDMGGLDWDAVREELLPEAVKAAHGGELRAVIRKMIGRLGQSHFAIIPGGSDVAPRSDEEPPQGCAPHLRDVMAGDVAGTLTPGFDVQRIEARSLVTRVEAGSASEEQGVGLGWEVVDIAGQRLDTLLSCVGLDDVGEEVASIIFGSVVDGLLMGPKSTVEVQFRDGDDRERTLELERRESDGESVSLGNLTGIDFQYEASWIEIGDGPPVRLVRFSSWMMPLAKAFEDTFLEATDSGDRPSGFIIDLRGNGGGVAGLAPGVAGYFFEEAADLGVMLNRGDELRLNINPRKVTMKGERVEVFEGPVAVLIDGGSASTSEIFAAGLQDLERARIFGEPTAGMALPSVVEELPNGDLLQHALADLERPNGDRIEGKPVQPDEPVPLTREGLLSGVDQPLASAVEWIQGQLKG